MTDLQSTNRVKIGKVRETTFGVTPATPAFKAIRQTSSGLALNPQTVASDEIRGDRQVTDRILVGYQAGGDIGGELAFRAADEDLEEALQGTWANNPYIEVITSDTEISDLSATTATVAAGGAAFVAGMLALLSNFPTPGNNKLARVNSSSGTTVVFPGATFAAETVPIPVGASMRVIGFQGAAGDLVAAASGMTSTALDFTTLGLKLGQWMKIGGTAAGNKFATAALNDWVRISAIAAHTLTFDRLPVGWATDSGAGQTVQVFIGDFLTNGSTKRSNTFERQFLDHSPVTYEYLRGQTLDRLSVTAQAQQVVKYSKTYVGSDGNPQTTRFAGATDIAAPGNDVLNAASNIGRVGFDGSDVNVAGPNYVMSASWEFNNNLRRQIALGNLGAVGIGNGEFTATGSLTSYFGSKAVLDLVVSNARTSFDTRLGRTDVNNETLAFDFPSIKLSAGSPSVSAKNSDVMLEAQFQALMDPTLGYTVSVGRFWFLP